MEVLFFLTDNCNFCCKYCYEGMVKEPNYMTEDVLRDSLKYIFDNLDDTEKIKITFLGGEPLLNKNIFCKMFEIIEHNYSYLKNHISYSITTNATLIDDEIINKFKQYNVEVGVSIDGDRVTHNLNRVSKNKEDVYDVITSNIHKMIEKEINMNARMTVTPNNVDRLFDNVVYLYNFGFNNIVLGINDFDEWKISELEAMNKELEKISKWYLLQMMKNIELKIDIFDCLFSSFLLERKVRFCAAGRRNHLCINTKGEFYPCSYVLNSKDWKLGDIYNGFSRNRFVEMAKTKINSEKKCEKCKYKYICISARCGFLNYKQSGYLNKAANYECEITKIIHKHLGNVIKGLYEMKHPKLLILLNEMKNRNMVLTNMAEEVFNIH